MTKTDDEFREILEGFIEEFDRVAGTLHRVEGERLHLVAHEGMPDSVLHSRRRYRCWSCENFE